MCELLNPIKALLIHTVDTIASEVIEGYQNMAYLSADQTTTEVVESSQSIAYSTLQSRFL